jgi:hypothetical protein
MNENLPKQKNTQKEGYIGPVIGTLIIVILLIAVAFYILSEHLNTVNQMQQEEQNVSTTTTIIYSTSTAPVDIQNDLDASPLIKSPGF